MDAAERLDELARDRDHGASEIASQARDALLAHRPTDRASRSLREAVLDLVRGHPSMAPIVHLAHQTLGLLDEDGAAGLARLERDRSPVEAIAETAAHQIQPAERVLTYSRSGTVLATLEAYLEQTGDLAVTLSEARPGNEGLTVASRLAEADADVELTYDAALPGLVDEADLVLVGADAITTDVFVNKTGTRLLLEQAQHADTDALVLAAHDKLWPPSLGPPDVSAQGDLAVDLPRTVDIHAPLFERIPLALADAIVTEDGPQEPGEVTREIGAIELNPDVVDAVG